MDLVAQTPLGANAAAVADQQHADHQLGIDRGPTNGAVVGRKLATDATQLNEAVDGAQQVIGRHVIVEVEAVEQRFLSGRSLAHHGRDPVVYREH